MNFTEIVTYNLITCGECGVRFYISADMDKRLRDTGRSFYCPNGDVRHYTENEADRLRKRLKLAEEENERTRSCLRRRQESLEREKRSHSATKGKHTKAMNRVKAGVCPFCRRTFQNLRRHMASKHGDEKCDAEAHG